MAGKLVADTIEGGSGGSFDPDDVATGYAKAWLSMDGSGTIAINADYNVDSLTDNATGDYDINFTNNMDSVNYTIATFCRDATSTTTFASALQANTKTVGAVQLETYNFDSAGNRTQVDCEEFLVTIFGG